MHDTTITPVSAGDDLPMVDEYRPFSLLAVIALLGGLASPLALVSTLLAIVPLLTILIAVLTLRKIASSSEPVGGARLAVTGLCLAMLFLGWGVGHNAYHQVTVRSQARQFADDWLKILATGDKFRAHQLHVASEYRLDPQTEMKSAYSGYEHAQNDFRVFYQIGALEVFVAQGPDVRYRFVEFVQQTHDQLGEQFVLKYIVETPAEPVPMWITVRRTYANKLRGADWELFNVTGDPNAVP